MCTHARTCAHVHACAHMRACARMHAHANANAHTRTHTCMCTHKCTHTCTQCIARANTHTHAHVHVRTQTCMHKHAHTHTRMRTLKSEHFCTRLLSTGRSGFALFFTRDFFVCLFWFGVILVDLQEKTVGRWRRETGYPWRSPSTAGTLPRRGLSHTRVHDSSGFRFVRLFLWVPCQLHGLSPPRLHTCPVSPPQLHTCPVWLPWLHMCPCMFYSRYFTKERD